MTGLPVKQEGADLYSVLDGGWTRDLRRYDGEASDC